MKKGNAYVIAFCCFLFGLFVGFAVTELHWRFQVNGIIKSWEIQNKKYEEAKDQLIFILQKIEWQAQRNLDLLEDWAEWNQGLEKPKDFLADKSQKKGGKK